jgi:enoyl-CoA hydratase
VRSLGWHDLAEGIRAQVVDKDRNPAWDPATVDAVDPAIVRAAFEPLERELGLARGNS